MTYVISYDSGSEITLEPNQKIADAMLVDGKIYVLFTDDPSAPKYERTYRIKLHDEYQCLENWTPISLTRHYNKIAYIAIQEVIEKGE